MSLELRKNTQLVNARFDAVNAHDWKRFQGLYSDSTIWHDAGLDEPIKAAQLFVSDWKHLPKDFLTSAGSWIVFLAKASGCALNSRSREVMADLFHLVTRSPFPSRKNPFE